MNRYRQEETKYKIKKYNSNSDVIIKDTKSLVLSYHQEGYNCFGYAMNYFDWLDLDSFWYNDEEDYEELSDIFEECCQELERRFELRRVWDPETRVGANEYLIAFRIGFDDFHFVRRLSDGTWSHKPGHNHIRHMSEEELLSDCWGDYDTCKYVSDIGYFIVNRKNKFYKKKGEE